MRKNFIVSCVIALALVGTSTMALAFGPGGHRGPGGEIKAYKLLFDEEQNKKLDEVLKKSRAESMPLVKQLMAEHKNLKSLVKSDTATEKDIRDEVAKASQIFADLAVKRAATMKEIRKIATKEQLAKIDAFAAKEEKRHEKFRENMHKMIEQGGLDD